MKCCQGSRVPPLRCHFSFLTNHAIDMRSTSNKQWVIITFTVCTQSIWESWGQYCEWSPKWTRAGLKWKLIIFKLNLNSHQSGLRHVWWTLFYFLQSGPPAPPSDASTVDAMIAHQVLDQDFEKHTFWPSFPQSVIASSHPDGSFFMTNNGTYVQLVNGVLTNVEIAPPPRPQVSLHWYVDSSNSLYKSPLSTLILPFSL